MTKEEMIKKFQCPGCVSGPDPKTCRAFKMSEEYGFKCGGHVLGTSLNMQIHIALGMPKGFNRTPPRDDMMRTRSQMELGMWLEGTRPDWDNLNVPVWALEQDDCLFVRTFSPRTDRSRIDIVEKGKLDMVPGALDVQKFYEEFD